MIQTSSKSCSVFKVFCICNGRPAEGALTQILTVFHSICFFTTHFLFGGFKARDSSHTFCKVFSGNLPYRAFLWLSCLSVLRMILPVYLTTDYLIIPSVLISWLTWCLCLDLLPVCSPLSFGLTLCMSTDWTVTLVLTLCLSSCFCLLKLPWINFC